MSEMIERVARALCAANGYLPDAVYWTLYTKDARAAIEAMREPTDGMVDAGHSRPNDFQYGHITVSEIYEAMIDAALSEKP